MQNRPFPSHASDLPASLRRAVGEGVGVALQDGSARLGWHELARLIAEIDLGLAAAGAGPGSVIAVPGRSTVGAAMAIAAVVASGRCASIVNPFQPAPSMFRAARMSGAAAILVGEDEVTDGTGECPMLVMRDDGGIRRHGMSPDAEAGGADRAIIVSTSGTTGKPKAIGIDRGLLAGAIADIHGFNVGFGDRPDAEGRWAPLLQYSPLAHIGGAITLLRGLATGRAVVMLGKFEASRWAAAVAEHRPVTTGLPPAMMRMVLDADVPPDALSSLVTVWSGSAPVRPETMAEFTSRYGLPVLGNYGATEFCGAVATWSLDDHRRFHEDRGSAAGRIRPSVARARIVDRQTGRLLPLGETGVLELQVRRVGPAWMTTTDLASLDAEGFLYLRGRADDVIVRGGFKISPDVVEEVIRRHAAVRDVSVVGIADARLGQVPVAAVELNGSGSGEEYEAIVADLLASVRRELPAYFAPVVIRPVPRLPRSPAMKVDRKAVRALFDRP